MKNIKQKQNPLSKFNLVGTVFLVVIFVVGGLFFAFRQKAYAAGKISVPRVDSDKDGILDFYEVNVYGTNPYNPDTDGDGYHDDMEIMWGYDPLNPSPKAKYLLSTFSPFLRTSDAYVSRHLMVKGNLVADDIVRIAKDLKVYGPAQFAQNLIIQGQVDFRSALLHQGKEPLRVNDNLEVLGTISAKNLKVKSKARVGKLTAKSITTNNLTVKNNFTVNDLILGRGGKNRPAVGGVSGKPLIVAGRKLATGERKQLDPSSSDSPSFREVPEAGVVYFPQGVEFKEPPAIILSPDADSFKMWQEGNEFSLEDLMAEMEKVAGEDGLAISFWGGVTGRILSSSGRIIGFRYKYYLAFGEKRSHEIHDFTPYMPISWIAYGSE